MTTPASQDAWDLDRIRQIVTQNELERSRIEYKRQLDDGRRTLEAITALANTFGGVVLVGVDEDQQGADRLTGVSAADRARLVSMCWSQLTPPFSPEIIPISLGHDDRYVLAVVVNTDYIRRPLMLNRGNRILVRLEGENQAPDWYRLRDLFTEQAASYQDNRLPPPDPGASTRQYPDTDIVLRGRLLLTGPRGRPAQITGAGRTATLATLNDSGTPLTGASSPLVRLMSLMIPRAFAANAWQLHGPADTRKFSARWEGLAPEPTSRRLTEARIHVEITPRPAQGDTLLINLEALLTDSHRPSLSEVIRQRNQVVEDEMVAMAKGASPPEAVTREAVPFIGFGTLREVALGITTTLWGPAGETLSTNILGLPLGPPAQLDLTICTTSPTSQDSTTPPLNQRIDFGCAQLIPGNTPGAWTNLGPVQPDRAQTASPAAQASTIHDWLIQFGIANGYHNIEQEVARWTEIPT